MFPEIPSVNRRYSAFFTYEAVKKKRCGFVPRLGYERSKYRVTMKQISSSKLLNSRINDVSDYCISTYNFNSLKKTTLLIPTLQKIISRL